MNFTPWFKSDIKPVRDGVYERQNSAGDIFYSYWNGRIWGMLSNDVQQAFDCKEKESYNQWMPWRGVFK